MKNSTLTLVLLLLSTICKAQTYVYPIIDNQDGETVVIEKIERTENNTIIYFKHFASNKYTNGGWVSFSEDTYIKAKGSSAKLKLIKAEGIPISPEKHQYSSKNDVLNFKLIFPLIKNNQSIDLIECEGSQSCFNFYGISLNQDDYGITQTVYYDKNYSVVPNKMNAVNYATYTKDQNGKLIDYIRFYDLDGNYLMRKYKGEYISNISFAYDILDGEQFSYDEFGNIRRKTLHINPNKIQFLKYLSTKNDIVYDFDTKGNLTQYTEFKNGEESKLIKYNNRQEIIYAKDFSDKYFYQGNPDVGYDLTYYEDFNENKTWKMPIRDYEAGKTSYHENGYLMESRNYGGLDDRFDIDFDMNKSNWIINTTFKRIASNQGAGISIGANEDGTSLQMFLIDGSGYYNYYNIYNGFNISSMQDYEFTAVLNKFYERNNLTIMKLEDKLFFSINGKSVYSTKFTPLSSNTAGIMVDKKDNKINFYNISIKKLDCSIPHKFYNPKNYISTESKFKGNGSGFLINTSGYIATNYHVIDGATEIFTEIEGKDYKCKLVAVDKENDLAIIKVIDKNNFTTYSTITSNKTETGSEIFVLGFPYALSLLGNEIKLTDGKVSSQTGFQGESRTYQITAPIQPGNSGGPLFNTDGNIVGIVSSKFTGGENVGYAIKSDFLLKFLAKNNLTYEKNNTVKNYSLIDKVKSLSKTTFLIKTI